MLDPKGAQELGPDSADEFPAAIGEEPAGCAKIRNNMAHKSSDCIRGMVVGGDDYGILRKAIHEDNQDLVAVIWGQWSHNFNRQCVPGALGLDSTRRFLAMAIVGA